MQGLTIVNLWVKELKVKQIRGGYFGGTQYGEESIIESGMQFYSEFFSQEADLNINLL